MHEPGHIAVGRERVELDIGPQHLDKPRHDRRPAARLRPRDDGVGAARARTRRSTRCAGSRRSCSSTPRTSRRSGAAFERAADLTELGLRRRPRVAALDAVARARRRRRSTRRRCARALGAIDEGHRAPPARLDRRRRCCSAAGSASRLGWRPSALAHRGDALTGHCRARRGEVALELRPERWARPGSAGVTIEMASGEAVSLDRGPGGLRAARRARDGEEQAWTVLGASRGEAGILGEGVRQALLRDPTYKPALAAGADARG